MALGILGVGHLAAALLAGLNRAGFAMQDIVVAPRGRSAELAARYGLTIARDNAELVARCDLVLLAVRPASAVPAVAGLPWRADQTVISVCAGVRLESLPVAPARAIRIMPLTAAEIGASPTVCYPDPAEAREVIAAFGPVIVLASEAEFQVATVSAAVYGWAQDLIRRSADWATAHGLDPAVARQLNAQTFVAAGALIDARPEPMADLLHELVTPGGITERGLDVLERHKVGEAWQEACEAVLAKLAG